MHLLIFGIGVYGNENAYCDLSPILVLILLFFYRRALQQTIFLLFFAGRSGFFSRICWLSEKETNESHFQLQAKYERSGIKRMKRNDNSHSFIQYTHT